MLSIEAAFGVEEILKPKMFYDERNQLIYEQQLVLANDNVRPDLAAVAEKLHKEGLLEKAGGTYYLSEINSSVPSAANAEYYSLIVKEKYLAREMIGICYQGLEKAYQEDPLELLEDLGSKIDTLQLERTTRDYKLIGDSYREVVEEIENPKPDDGLEWPWKSLRRFGKLRGGQVMLLAADTSIGKTAFALNATYKFSVIDKIPGAYFSLEMSQKEDTIRLISMPTKIAGSDIDSGNLTPQQIQTIKAAKSVFENSPLILDDTPGIKTDEILPKLRYYKKIHKIKYAVIDYVQLMQGVGKFQSREAEVTHISRKVLAAARKLNIPIIAVAQLNRDFSKRANKRPTIGDIRESGALEQDSFRTIFLYRPEKYGMKFENEVITENRTEVIFDKNRGGPTGSEILFSDMAYSNFMDLTIDYEEPPGCNENKF